MARVRIELYYDGIGAAMRLSPVRTALRRQAESITARARGLSENPNATITTESGTRPRGRPYARTVSDAVEEEWGSAKTPRRRTLARAAGL